MTPRPSDKPLVHTQALTTPPEGGVGSARIQQNIHTPPPGEVSCFTALHDSLLCLSDTVFTVLWAELGV